MTIDFLYKFIGIVAIIIGVVAWLIRLEAKVMYLEKDHNAHKEVNEKRDYNLWTKIDGMQTSIIAIKETLARIEERLKQKE